MRPTQLSAAAFGPRGDVAAAIVYHARFLSLPVRGGRLTEHG
jgi:hypothetical protein